MKLCGCRRGLAREHGCAPKDMNDVFGYGRSGYCHMALYTYARWPVQQCGTVKGTRLARAGASRLRAVQTRIGNPANERSQPGGFVIALDRQADGVAHVSSPAPRPSGGKPRLRRVPHDGRVGSGLSNASQQSCAQQANAGVIVETAPPRIGTPAARFSRLT